MADDAAQTPQAPLMAVPVARPHVAPQVAFPPPSPPLPKEPVVSDKAADAPLTPAPERAPVEEQGRRDPAPALSEAFPPIVKGEVHTIGDGCDPPHPEPAATCRECAKHSTGVTAAEIRSFHAAGHPKRNAPVPSGGWHRIDYGKRAARSAPVGRASAACLYVGDRYSSFNVAGRKWLGDKPWRVDFHTDGAGGLSIVKGPDCSVELTGDKGTVPAHVVRAVFADLTDLTHQHTWRLEPTSELRRRLLVPG